MLTLPDQSKFASYTPVILYIYIYLTPSYFNNTLEIFACIFIYIHFSDFPESYETLASTSIQIPPCILMIKYRGFWVAHTPLS